MTAMQSLTTCLALFILPLMAESQKSNCKVEMEGLEAEYKGECKKGLAHGEGVASGTRGKYTGSFSKGFADGKGGLIYADGSVYDGDWDKGEREGYGVLTKAGGEELKGYWKDDEYIGPYEKPFKIISSRGPAKADFRKRDDNGYTIEILFRQSGVDGKGLIRNVNLYGDSGSFQHSQNFTGFDGVKFPLKGRIDFNAPNRLQTVESQCTFEFEIYEAGNWEIIIDF